MSEKTPKTTLSAGNLDGGHRTIAGWSGWNADSERSVALYTKLVNTFGDDVRALNWGSKQSQERRFEVLSEVGQLEGKSMLDIGCGTGDLYRWLTERAISISYAGVDITPAMIETARKRFPGVRFELADVLQSPLRGYDYVFASGIFTYRKNDAMGYVQAMVRRMFEMCAVACAFNCLSRWGSNHGPEEFFADPVELLGFCKTLTERLVLRHDYHPRDFTVYLYKPETR